MLRTLLTAGAFTMTLATGAAADDSELHAAWDDLLGTYVVPGDDGVNRFDYGGLKANAEDSAKLDAILRASPGSTLNRSKRMSNSPPMRTFIMR